MRLKDTFKKQGGMKLLKKYWKSGALFTAVSQFILLGRSRTALELLRLSAGLKTKQKLEKKYRNELREFDRTYDTTLPHESSNKVWICWFQGMENAPKLVQKCYQSVKDNMPDKEIIVLTSENIDNYVKFPDYIQFKIEKGIISGAHLSDLLRLELLIKYGGTWMDATIFCSGSNIPAYMLDSDLFLFQCMKPGRDGHSTTISNWFITATSNNKILMAVRWLLYAYWEDNNEVCDYFIFHDFFQIVIEKYVEEWQQVVPFSNSVPHMLLLRLFDKYDEKIWMAIKEQSPFHKLTYKFGETNTAIQDTYYRKIIE